MAATEGTKSQRQTTLDNEDQLITPMKFLPFSKDKDGVVGYGGYSPSASYIKSHYLKGFQKREGWCFNIMQQINGFHMKSDISYKVVKKGHVDGCRVFEGCLTIMNEHNQVGSSL
jgi:hypothetical protein